MPRRSASWSSPSYDSSSQNGLVDLFSALNLKTSDLTLISHTHGQQRREERGIDRRQLQEAVKYGCKERANPGRDGKLRWRYTYNGIVYITDETSRHEITSWKLDDAFEAPPPVAGPTGAGKSHVVVIVDSSGSMRKGDVPGYPSRTAAVYDCLARDLLEPQLKVQGGSMQVSLIEFSDEAKVVVERSKPTKQLTAFIKARASSYARSHGNYLPALDKALELLKADVGRQSQLFLIFLSDGAPSDLGSRDTVTYWCVEAIKEIGDLLGRDRVFMGTVAFGPPSENYDVLKSMAEALPRSSFQKLGLSAACLRTAFTSLTSSLTMLRTEVAAGTGSPRGLTLRGDISTRTARKAYEERTVLTEGRDWNLYCGSKLIAKRRYDLGSDRMVHEPYTELAVVTAWSQLYVGLQRGVAHAMHKFGEGAERAVFQCTEVVTFDSGRTGYCVGPRLVAKSTRFTQHLDDEKFHRAFCKTQGEAEEMAKLFNRRLQGGPEWKVRFLPCFVYTVEDYRLSRRGELDILVEEELEGKFTKWNNNNGGVSGSPVSQLGAILEDDEDEYDSDYEEVNSYGGAQQRQQQATAEHVPQCFSHFTYHVTDGRKLVCDLQGVWNAVDGFVLTDPVIHHHTGSKRNGATDKGPAGIRSFFSTHVCNPLCRRLGLPPGPSS